MKENTSAITLKEFVEKLTAGGGGNPSPAACVEYGLQRGWLEQQDAANRSQPLLRKHAARIIHNYLRMEVEEADEVDGSPAYVLQDLFDCRVCAGHIIQVYVKGIMDGVVLMDERQMFAANKEVSLSEAEEMIARVFRMELRVLRREESEYNNVAEEPEEITLEQAMRRLQEDVNTLLVDVRTEREYEENHLENAMCVPLMSIIKNPFVFSGNRDKMIVLYCKEGVQSEAAAKCLREAGYGKVAYFAWKPLK